jgi:BirA family biotin operon repressor/biotin-[acetyl-CoA-carboxylase] ligase
MPNIHFFDSLESTQKYAKEHLEEFEDDFLSVVWAKEQICGVGRKNDHWVSKKGDLFFTFCTFAKDFLHSEPLIFICALSVVKVLKKRKIALCLKWPNDLLFHRKKVGGLLANVISFEDKKAVLIGLGLNVNLKDVSSIGRPATSLFLETHKKIDEKELGFEIIAQFEKDLVTFLADGFDPFYEDLLKHMIHKPKDMLTIDVNGKKISANFHTITYDGFLQVLQEGRLLTLTTGTIDAF